MALPRIEIPRFPNNKRIAVTTSWDDGVVEDRVVVERMNKLGLKGTFNLNSGTFRNTGVKPPLEGGGRLDVSEVAELYKGHEVAIHTVSHPHLPLLDRSQIVSEVLDDRKALEDIVGYPVRGMAYPFGTFDERVIEVLRSLGIVYCRDVANRDPCFPPVEPLAWASTGHQFNPELPKKWDALVNGNYKRSGVFFVWGHSYEFAQSNHSWDEFDRVFEPLANHPDAWYCTNIELFDYEAARKALVLAANRKTAYNPSAIPVTIKIGDRLVNILPGRVTQLDESGSK